MKVADKLKRRVTSKSSRDVGASETPTFSSRWRGRFKAARPSDKRYRLLATKYL